LVSWYQNVSILDFIAVNTLTAATILGQTRLPMLNPKFQLSKNKVHLQPMQTVLFPFTRWQHTYYILEMRQAAPYAAV